MTSHLYVNDPSDLSLLARQGSDGKIRDAALKKILSHPDIKKLCEDEDFWFPGWSAGNSLLFLDPNKITAKLLEVKPKSKWWINPSLRHCSDGEILLTTWKYFKRLRRNRPIIDPSVLANDAMTNDLRHEVALSMLSQPDNQVLILIREIEAHVPDLDNWEEHLSLENLSFTGHVSLYGADFNNCKDQYRKMIEGLQKKALNTLNRKVAQDDLEISYIDIANFTSLEFTAALMPIATKVANKLAKIALSDELLTIPSDENFDWEGLAESEATTARTRCLYHISLSRLISSNLRTRAADAALQDLIDLGSLQFDKIPFAENFSKYVPRLFPEDELYGHEFSIDTLQCLCITHGQEHAYIRDTLKKRSASKETQSILAELSK